LGINIKILPAINKLNSIETRIQAVSALNESNLNSKEDCLSVDDLHSENI